MTAIPSGSGVVLFELPKDPALLKPSQRFMAEFNRVGAAFGLSWQDQTNPLVVDSFELTIAPEFRGKYGLTGDSNPKLFTPALRADVETILRQVETERQAQVKEGQESVDWIKYQAPLHFLRPVEQVAVRLIHGELEPLISQISARQFTPDAPALAAYMAQNGGALEKEIFAMALRDSCSGKQADVTGSTCSLFPFFPDRPALNGMIRREDVNTAETFSKWGATLASGSEELRPTTVLEPGKVVPLPLHPDYKEDHQAAALVLDKLAALQVNGEGLDPLLQQQFLAWAKFFRTGSAADEAAAVQATIDAGESESLLRVHLGPSESYWADNTKFPYLLQVGIVDPRLREKLTKGKKDFLMLEAALTGIPHYQPRELHTRGGFADPMYQPVTGGFVKSFMMVEVAGNNFPNYEPYSEEFGVTGSNRFIILEVLETQVAPLKEGLGRLLDEDVSDLDVRTGLIDLVVDHESGHLLGPQRGHVVPNGQKMGGVFGANWGHADEPKADLTRDAKAYLQRKKLGPKARRDIVLVSFGFHLGSRYKGKKNFSPTLFPHYFGHLVELGYFFKSGAVSLVTGKDGAQKIHVDCDKYLASAYDLWRTIIGFQAAGDVKGYLDFASEMAAQIPDEADQMILAAKQGSKLVKFLRHVE